MLKARNLKFWLTPVRVASICTDELSRISLEVHSLKLISRLISRNCVGFRVKLVGSSGNLRHLRLFCLSVHLYKECNKL